MAANKIKNDAQHIDQEVVDEDEVALRLATESSKAPSQPQQPKLVQQQQQQQQQQRFQQRQQDQQQRIHQHVHQHHHQNHSQYHSQNQLVDQQQQALLTTDSDVPVFKLYDLKSKDSKYKRWSPRMDQYLIKLLSDVVHSFPKGVEAKMTKKAWAYVTSRLRAANPETVYSTYTKYSCQQHLSNVNHHRYKVWVALMTHQKPTPSPSGFSYRWDPNDGKFQIYENSSGALIDDERQVKSLLYSDGLSLPDLGNFNKNNLIVNDFFFTDNLKYMSTYHNDVLPLLMRLEDLYSEGLEDIYHRIPKFDFPDAKTEYFKPLIPARLKKTKDTILESKKRTHSDINQSGNHRHISPDTHLPEVNIFLNHDNGDRSDLVGSEESVDPMLKRVRNTPDSSVNPETTTDFENAIASAAIAAIDSPALTNGRDPPVYFKERKWFNKLMSLYNSDLITSDEVLTVCEGVRDGKIPIFMLNVLDNTYYAVRNGETHEVETEDISDTEVVKRIRQFMLPMTFTS